MDIPTLALLLALTGLLSFLSLLLLGLSFSFQQGTLKWMLGSFSQGLGSFLILQQGTLDPFWSIFVANIFIFVSYVLFYEGLLQFRELPSRWKWHVVFLLVMSILFLLLYRQPEAFSYRVQLNAFGLSLYSGMILFHLFQNQKFAKISSSLLGLSFLALLMISVYRLILTFNYQEDSLLLSSSLGNGLIFLAGIMIISFYTSGLILMVSEREKYLIQIAHQEQRYVNEVLDQNLDHHKNFVFAIAHEFVNPIASIQSSEQILKTTPSSDPLFQQELARIDRSLLRMQKTIKDAADLNKPLNYLTQQFQEKVEVQSVIQDVCAAYRVTFIDQIQHATYVTSEKTLLSLVLSNLISNALKYCHRLSSVSVSLSQTDQEIQIQIQNDGEQLASDQQIRIFERNYQKSSTEGFGFGLYFVKNIIERMKGSIAVQSDLLTTFTILLPYHQEPIS